jgi:hypothetical protein
LSQMPHLSHCGVSPKCRHIWRWRQEWESAKRPITRFLPEARSRSASSEIFEMK